MKVSTYVGGPTITSGDMKIKDVTIGQSAQAQAMVINILVNSLYTDKPSAVWREYGCNGADANIEAGKAEVPIEITLPSKTVPMAVIRDFGRGMTEQQVDDVFCQLGESTKRDSNSVTGMMGIGAKAGYAYGDMFTVTTFNGGVKTIYQFFREESRFRRAIVLQEPTESPEGTEISVPVAVADLEDFRDKAERTFRYFKTKPIVHGGEITYFRTHPVFHGTDWRITGDGSSVAVMGNVGYDLTTSGLGVLKDSTEQLLDLGIEIDFEIGDIDIAANREALQYTDKTKQAILKKTKRILTEVAKVFTQQIANAANLWEAKAAYAEAFEKMGTADKQNLRDIIDTKVTWGGKPLNSGRFYLAKDGYTLPEPGNHIVAIGRDSYGRKRIRRDASPSWVWPSAESVLVINDLPKRKLSPARVAGFFLKNPNARMIVFTFADSKVQADFWKEFELDGAPTTLLSSIPPLLTSKGSSSGGTNQHRSKHSARALVLDETVTTSRYSNKVRSHWWTPAIIDLKTDSGVYVVLDKFRVAMAGDDPIEPDEFLTVVHRLRKAGVINGPVYAFKGGDKMPTLGKNWTPLLESTKAFAEKTVADHAQQIADYRAGVSHDPLLPVTIASLLPEGQARDYIETVVQMRKPSGITPTLIQLLQEPENRPWVTMNTRDLPDATFDLRALAEGVGAAYPMLGLLDHFKRNSLTILADYIKLVG